MNRQKIIYLVFVLTLLVAFLVNISIGSVAISIKDILGVFFGDLSIKPSHEYIILNYRLPKALVAILVGIALSMSGLLMQTLFKNPMAESYVLGISSGASLGVAFLLLGSSLLPATLAVLTSSSMGIAVVSILGSLLLLLLVLAVSNKVKQSATILIVGLMFGSFANAFISVLSFFSSAEQLKRYSLWSMGSLGNLPYSSVFTFGCVVLVGFAGTLFLIRSLDALLLGDQYAQSMGIDVKSVRNKIILVTAILAGGATAFVGPIAFIGLAVPHIARKIVRSSSHRKLILLSALIGAILMLVCDTISQINAQSYILPINAVTSMFGAPIVIWLLLRQRWRA